MTVTELRPLSLGELLDRTFSYYRQHFWLFIGIMAIPQVLNVAITLPLETITQPSAAPVASENPTEIFRKIAPLLALSLGLVMVALVVGFLIYSVALGATTFALSEVHLGRMATVRGAYQSLKGKVGRLIGVTFLILVIALGAYLAVAVAAVALGGALAFLVSLVSPGQRILIAVVVVLMVFALILAGLIFAVVFLLRYAVAIPALVLENLGIGQALKRSAFLTRGYKGQIFLIALLMYLITAVVGIVFQAPFFVAALLLGFRFGIMPIWLRIPYAVSAGVGGALAGPFLMIALALAYYDTRVRKEGFDLQLMVAALDQTSPAQGTVAVPPAAAL